VGYHYNHEIDLNNPDDLYTKVFALAGKRKRILDVGCGSGQMGEVLTEQAGCKVTGLESDEHACSLARKRLWKVVHGDAERLVLEHFLGPVRFDVILCLDVLEHMIDPWGFLHRIKERLDSGGFLIATLPNVAHSSVILELLAGKFTYRDLGLLDRNHLRFFTLDSIKEMFHRAGFKIEHLDRNRVELKYVELKVDPKIFPSELLTYICGMNESETYQFIVKAVPFSGM